MNIMLIELIVALLCCGFCQCSIDSSDAAISVLSNFTDRKLRNMDTFRWMLSFDRGPGEACETPFQCVIEAVCVNGICTCNSDFYLYVSPGDPKLHVCRRKASYGEQCYLTADCKAQDPNTACINKRCFCEDDSHAYLRNPSATTLKQRCYKVLDSSEKECEIDEQCFRFADRNHKCRCHGVCSCYFVRFEQVGIGVVLFIFLFLVARVTWKRRHYQLNSLEEQQVFDPRPYSRGSRRHFSRRTSSNILRHDADCPNNLLAPSEEQYMAGSSGDGAVGGPGSLAAARCYPYASVGISMDGPPSYDDVVKSELCPANDPPPPPYQEVTEAGRSSPKVT